MPVDSPPFNPGHPSSGIRRVGVLSDTHGHLHPAIPAIFKRTHCIIHTGDIESPAILPALGRIAPVVPVRGNMDFGRWATNIPHDEMITVGDITIYALHDLTRLSLDPAAAGVDVILSGHTHQAKAFWQDGCLFLNPGSASLPRRHRTPTVAILEIDGSRINHRFITLAPI